MIRVWKLGTAAETEREKGRAGQGRLHRMHFNGVERSKVRGPRTEIPREMSFSTDVESSSASDLALLCQSPSSSSSTWNDNLNICYLSPSIAPLSSEADRRAASAGEEEGEDGGHALEENRVS